MKLSERLKDQFPDPCHKLGVFAAWHVCEHDCGLSVGNSVVCLLVVTRSSANTEGPHDALLVEILLNSAQMYKKYHSKSRAIDD